MNSEASYIEKYGNDKEKQIYQMYKNITSRDYYATSNICIKFYCQLKSKLYTLNISLNSISYKENHMGVDGRIYKKDSKYFEENFTSQIGDSFISGMYNLIHSKKPNNYANRKYYSNFIEINMFDEYGVSFYSYAINNVEPVVKEIKKILGNNIKRIKDVSFLDIYDTDC